MEWWQNLLISSIPAILTAGITLIVSLAQIKRAKAEIKTKYESDKKQHISKMRLDMEFSIYKELSEKVVSLVAYCLGYAFYRDFDYNQIGTKIRDKEDIKSLDKHIDLFNAANRAINMYAVFIPEKWYSKFDVLKELCRKQLSAFENYVVNGKTNNKSIISIKRECNKRRNDIKNVFGELVSELRDYIATLDTQSTGKK